MWHDLRTYARERLFIPKIWALWLLLLVGYYLVNGPNSAFPIWGATVLTISLVAFRIIDDIADRVHDSMVNPTRCIVRTQHLNLFKVLAAVMVIAAAVLIFVNLGPTRSFCFVVLATAVLVAGRGYTMGQDHRATVVHVILLKYPAILLLVASEPFRPQSLLFAAIILVVLLAEEHFGRRAI